MAQQQEPSPLLSPQMLGLVSVAVQAAASASVGDAFGRALTFDLPVKRGILREAVGDAHHLRAERAQLQLNQLVLDCAGVSETRCRP